jgi:hypothetical protein
VTGIGHRPAAGDVAVRPGRNRVVAVAADGGERPRGVHAEPPRGPREQGHGAEIHHAVGGDIERHAGRSRSPGLRDLTIFRGKISHPHLAATGGDIVAPEDRHLVPARQVDLAVRREKTGEPIAIEWQRRMGMPNQADQQILLIEGERARRKPLRLRKRPEELVENILHTHRRA